MAQATIQQTLIECARTAGRMLSRRFGHVTAHRHKDQPSSVVSEADIASEKVIVHHIRSRFPHDNIIAEETGYLRGSSMFTWVVDPLDGTSNFVAKIPWFGVQIAVLNGPDPVLAVIYLPMTDTLYFSERGQGVYRDNKPVKVCVEKNLQNVLCSFGMDSLPDKRWNRLNAELLFKVASAVRNIRSTNSLIDFCYTIDGRLGGCINLNSKIWDIAPVGLMLPEAGGKLTDLNGRNVDYAISQDAFERDYAVLGGSKILHSKLRALIRR